MAEWFTYTGPTTITSSGDFGTLVPGTDYYVLAFGYADGAAATELTKHKFTTDPEGDPTANTFAFDISGVTARSASIQVEPSDKSVRYIWDIVIDAEYKKYGGTRRGHPELSGRLHQRPDRRLLHHAGGGRFGHRRARRPVVRL